MKVWKWMCERESVKVWTFIYIKLQNIFVSNIKRICLKLQNVRFEMDWDSLRLSDMASDGLRWCKIVSDGLIWSEMTWVGVRWSEKVRVGVYFLVVLCSMWANVGLAKVHRGATPPSVMVLFIKCFPTSLQQVMSR